MHNVTTSRHIRAATELFIMVPIKNDFVPITELVLTYAGRVSSVLKLLGDVRQQKTERGFSDPIGPIELLNTIFRVQWSVLDPRDDVKSPDGVLTPQLRQPQILLSSNFDSSWETYFRALVEIGGPLLDLIFSHCEGYEGHTCKHGFEKFSDFIRSHQRPVDFYYATAPELTIDDVRYFNRLPKRLLDAPDAVRTLTVPTILTESKQRIELPEQYDERSRAAYRTIHALLDVRKRLFTADKKSGIAVPGGGRLTDRMLFDNAVRSILKHEPDFSRLASVLRHRLGMAPPKPVRDVDLHDFVEPHRKYADELSEAAEWIEALVGSQAQEGNKKPPPNTPKLPKPSTLFQDVQGNILSGYSGIEAGQLLMFQCRDARALRKLLREAHKAVTTEAESQRGNGRKARCNVAITYSGIKLLGLPTRELEIFPREFREGMEERAGILGDVGLNHPAFWRLPRHKTNGDRIHLSAIHAVVIVLGRGDAAFKRALTRWQSIDGRELIHTVELTSTSQPERSQPIPAATYRSKPATGRGLRPAAHDEVSLNQFLLGYEDHDDVKPVDDAGNALPRAYPTEKETAFGKRFMHGSFLAVRKMMQDDDALEAYVDQVAGLLRTMARSWVDPGVLREDARALIIGRRKDGTLLGGIQPPPSAADAGQPSNDFDFARDPDGDVCPFQSHVRRSNPRIAGTPRIVRRGLAYRAEADGPEAGDKGLVFMAYCASLARQYEVVQRWVNGANSTGISSRQNDMLCGVPIDDDIERKVSLKGTSIAALVGNDTTITLPRRDPMRPFVTLRWGLYLFVPSKSGLDWLSTPRTQTAWARQDRAAAVARGEMAIREIEALPTAELRAFAWKRILEEVPEAGSAQARHAQDVTAAITDKRGGVIVVPKIVEDEPFELGKPRKRKRSSSTKRDMVIVTTERLAHAVLSDDSRFSVRHYRARMNQAIHDHYLGYDFDTKNAAGLGYADLSTGPNAEFEKLADKAFSQARERAQKLLDDPQTIELDPDHESADKVSRSTISVRDLATAVIAELSHDWLDMPGVNGATGRRALMDSLERFLVASRYCFQVMPVPYLKQQALAHHASIERDYDKLSFQRTPHALSNSVTPSLIRRFDALPAPARRARAGFSEKEFCKIAVLGTVGFAPPAVGALLRILDQWIETEELWQIQALIRPLHKEQQFLDVLLPKIAEAWSKTPAPPTLYRTARKPIKDFGGRVDIEEGTRVVVCLSAVYADAVQRDSKNAAAWLFGGVHGGAKRKGSQTRHGCPGRVAGLNALAGIITALLERKSLRRERRFLLSYERTRST